VGKVGGTRRRSIRQALNRSNPLGLPAGTLAAPRKVHGEDRRDAAGVNEMAWRSVGTAPWQ
jgi:hypothetical protein